VEVRCAEIGRYSEIGRYPILRMWSHGTVVAIAITGCRREERGMDEDVDCEIVIVEFYIHM